MRLFSVNLRGYKLLAGQSRSSSLPFGVSSRVAVLFGFLVFYILAVFYCYSHFYRDPTSAFWDPTHGYDRAYSRYREREAEAFIDANNVNSSVPRTGLPSPEKPAMCLGLATIARPNTQYIQKTVGSLMHGLTAEERDSLHFIFFIAHSNLSDHPIHGEPWTWNLPDTLLDYNREDNKTIDQIKSWEETKNHRDKGFYDYTYLLNACKATGAPYVAMLEGDVLAVPGWYQRSMQATRVVDGQPKAAVGASDSTKEGNEDEEPSWLYIRMFWTETYLGWNSEEWPTYLFWSASIWVATMGGLVVVRFISPQARSLLPGEVLLTVGFVCLPLCISLYFAAGRVSMQPPPPGIRRMDNFGCCSQGMIFKNEQVPRIIDAIDKRLQGYMDMLLETLAARDGLEKWAIYPSLLQHIGGESSKGDAVADARARMIWNFAFERYGEYLEAGRRLWET